MKKCLTPKRQKLKVRQMHTAIITQPSRYDLDEHSRQQLAFVRAKYGSLSRFLTKKEGKDKAAPRFVAIYGRDRTDTTTASIKNK